MAEIVCYRSMVLASLLLFSIHLEAEEGVLTGVQKAAERHGFTGSGYVTAFDAPGDKVTLPFRGRKGIYDVEVRFSAREGPKGFELSVNGIKSSGMFPKTGSNFTSMRAGKVELKDGDNELTFEKGWGYYDLDAVDLTPSSPTNPLKRVKPLPADAKASNEVIVLLKGLCENYGRITFSGQYDMENARSIQSSTGQAPAVLGEDFMEYSPSRVERGADTKRLTERIIRELKPGQILTMSWHWNAPTGLIDKVLTDAQGRRTDAQWFKGFYTNATTFNLEKALANPSGWEYGLLLRDIDAIAIQLKKLAAKRIPILWRPLHEAEGRWFWWGAKGPEPYKKLWRLMFERLTGKHNLHNLLWVHNCLDPTWYPGDKYVDVIGVDAYPADKRDSLSMDWEKVLAQFDGKKLLAITEFGGVPDIDRAWKFGVRWSYFVSWVGTTSAEQIHPTELKRLYGAKRVHNFKGGRP